MQKQVGYETRVYNERKCKDAILPGWHHEITRYHVIKAKIVYTIKPVR